MQKTILILVVPVFILTLSLIPMNDVNATSPTHHWNFEEGSGTTANDQSGTEDGIIHGGTWVDSGAIGGALNYNGIGDYVALPGGTDAFSEYTISLWFNANTLSGRQFLYQEGGNDNGINLYLLNNKLFAGVYSETYGFSGQWIQHQNSVTSGWHFAVVVYNSIDHYFQLYLDGVRTAINFSPANIGQEVNGVILAESGVGTEIYRHVGKASIGSMLDYTIIETGEVNNPGIDYFFNGTIDEVKLYHDVAISLTDIQNEYSDGQCDEDTWVCDEWNECSPEGEQTRECSLTNDCVFVDTSSPDTTQICEYVSECTEDIWECGTWSECSLSGLQSRSCEIANECANVSTPSPDTSQSCAPSSGSGSSSGDTIPTCSADTWTCEDWSECSSVVTPSPDTVQDCDFPDEEDKDVVESDDENEVSNDKDSDGVLDGDDFCANTIIKETITEDSLNPEHYSDLDGDGFFEVKRNNGEDGFDIFDSVYTIQQTHGCTCEQIVNEKSEGSAGESKNGCAKGTIENWINQRGVKEESSANKTVKIKNLIKADKETVEAVSGEEADEINESEEFIEMNDENKKIYEKVIKEMEGVSSNFNRHSVVYLIQEGTPTTKKMGAGERAGALSSFISAFDKVPETKEDWQDVVKIANGRWPSKQNKEKEEKMKKDFKKIYLREPNEENQNDDAALTVMTYGLRPADRNMNSEQTAIKTFEKIYSYKPESASDWDIVRAIAYSGAVRGVDTDGDMLIDSKELELGTDPNNKDTDGDGYMDGVEVVNGYDPLKKEE